MTLDELLAELEATDTRIDELLANDALTDEQRAEHDALVADRAKTVKAIDAQKGILTRKAERERLRAEVTTGFGRKTSPDEPHAGDIPAERGAAGQFKVPATVRRFGSLKNFRGPDAEAKAYRFGMWGLAMLGLQMPGRFNSSGFRRAIDEYPKLFGQAPNQSDDANGTGYLIPEEFGTDMIILRERYGVARRLLKTVPMSSDTRTDPRRASGLTAFFVNEGNAGTESNKQWSQVRLTAKEIMVLSRYTSQVNMDSVINFGDDLAGEIAYAYTLTEDQAAFNGDGTSTYGHISGFRTRFTNYDGQGSTSTGLITAATTGAWSSLILSDFDRVVGKLPQYADNPDRCCWVMHRTFYYSVCLPLLNALGGVTLREAFEAQQGEGARKGGRPLFQGYPVEFSQVWPSTTGAGQICCMFGDLALAASFGDRQMDSIAFSEHAVINGQSVFERNEIAIRGIERIDVNVHDVGTSTTPGPVTALTT